MLLATSRAVSIKATCCSRTRTPRELAATRYPIAASTIVTNARVTTASIMVNPPSPSCSGDIVRDNVNASRQPVHPHLEPATEPHQPDHAAAGHPGGEEADRRERGLAIAAFRQQCIEC